MEKECFSRSGNRNTQTLLVEKGRNKLGCLEGISMRKYSEFNKKWQLKRNPEWRIFRSQTKGFKIWVRVNKKSLKVSVRKVNKWKLNLNVIHHWVKKSKHEMIIVNWPGLTNPLPHAAHHNEDGIQWLNVGTASNTQFQHLLIFDWHFVDSRIFITSQQLNELCRPTVGIRQTPSLLSKTSFPLKFFALKFEMALF